MNRENQLVEGREESVAEQAFKLRGAVTPESVENPTPKPVAPGPGSPASAQPQEEGDLEKPEEDPFGFDHALRERVIPIFRFLYERYWRVEVRGLHHIPSQGAAIIVSNHSGALPFDGCMLVTAVRLKHPAERTLRFLYDRFVDNLPGVGAFYRGVGGAPASYANAARLIAAGQLVMTFPEGVAGVAKPFSERYQLRSFSTSFVRLSLTHRVPIIPVAVVGAEEAAPVVARINDPSRLLGLPYIPITPFFPLLGALGALPLPTKWSIRVGKPIEFYKMPTRPGAPNPALLPPRELSRRVRRRISDMVSILRERRQSIFFG